MEEYCVMYGITRKQYYLKSDIEMSYVISEYGWTDGLDDEYVVLCLHSRNVCHGMVLSYAQGTFYLHFLRTNK